MSFAENFKKARKAAGLSQQQVADALGLDRTAIAHYERGASKPQFENISKICELLSVPVNELID
ncbi:MAG: helix-turn-helix domain-containing protein [Clostridia bacterium]|nr:helix-turn-helix domain-containing protein [Clostridia bacterium]